MQANCINKVNNLFIIPRQRQRHFKMQSHSQQKEADALPRAIIPPPDLSLSPRNQDGKPQNKQVQTRRIKKLPGISKPNGYSAIRICDIERYEISGAIRSNIAEIFAAIY